MPLPPLPARAVLTKAPIYKMPAPKDSAPVIIAEGSTPKVAKPEELKPEKREAPFIFQISKIDVMVDRYRCLNLTKDQTLNNYNRYPKGRDLTDKDLQDHAVKLHGRGRNTYCGFRQWSPDAKFIDEVSYTYSLKSVGTVLNQTVPNGFSGFKRFANEFQYYKKVAANYLAVTDIPHADPHGNKPRDIERRAARLNALFTALFSEAELLQWVTERTHCPTFMDAVTALAAYEFFNPSDSDDDDNEFVEQPDGSLGFQPTYVERVNSEDSAAVRAEMEKSLLVSVDEVEFKEIPGGSVRSQPANLERAIDEELAAVRAVMKKSTLVPVNEVELKESR